MIDTAPRSRRRSLTPSPAVRAKAVRLLGAGRVRVLEVDTDRAVVEVAGDTATYRVEVDGSPRCPCPARGVCAHVHAATLVAGPSDPCR